MIASIGEEDIFLTFTALEDNSSIELRKIGTPTYNIPLEYQVNKGSWQAYTYNDVINLDNGDKISFRNSSDTVYTNLSRDGGSYYKFYMSGTISASGNIMSLLDKTCTSLRCGIRCFYNLFQSCSSLVSAPKFPATSVDQFGYNQTFAGCSNLTKAPDLYMENLTNNLYYTFSGCTSLRYIKIYGTSISGTNPLYRWVRNVADSGVFVCDSSLNIPSGEDGIPSGWTRLNLDGTPYVEP